MSEELRKDFKDVSPDVLAVVGSIIQSNYGRLSDDETAKVINEIVDEKSLQEILNMLYLMGAWNAKFIEDISKMSGKSIEETFSILANNQLLKP